VSSSQVFEIVKGHVLEVLPDLAPGQVTPERSLSELGANSVDRMEVVSLSLQSLGLDIPLMSFAGVSDIGGLVDVLARHAGQ
jgi:polyketide biosynthesis acyl carrier protein